MKGINGLVLGNGSSISAGGVVGWNQIIKSSREYDLAKGGD